MINLTDVDVRGVLDAANSVVYIAKEETFSPSTSGREIPPEIGWILDPSFLRILEMLGLCSTCGRGNPKFFQLDM